MISEEARSRRFWKRVRIRGADDCWWWTGARQGRTRDRSRYLYGKTSINYRVRQAHAVAWELANQQAIPEGKQANHTCDNGLCCNPAHVYPGTQLDNMRDMDSRGRRRKSFGERNGQSKLSREDVQYVRKRLRDGATQAALAKELGVWRTTISKIAHRQTRNTE